MKKLIYILVSLTFSIQSFGFTEDHKEQIKNLQYILPIFKKFNKDSLKKMEELVMIPDSYETFDKNMLTEEEIEYLKEHRIFSTDDLHKPASLPLMFKLLVDAIKDKEKEKILLWISCISHNVNDSLSWHYDAKVDFYRNYLLKTDNTFLLKSTTPLSESEMFGTSLKLAYIRPEGDEILSNFKGKYTPKVLGENSVKKLVEFLLLKPYLLRDYANKNMTTFSDCIDLALANKKSELKKGYIKQAEMGVEGLRVTADIVHTAFRYAEEDFEVKVTKAIEESEKTVDLHIKMLKLDDTSVFKGLIPEKEDAEAKVGIVIEPEYFSASILGRSSKVLSSCMMKAMKKNSIKYNVVDIRNLIKKELPDPKKVPVMIIAAETYQNYRSNKRFRIDKRFKKYVKGGGRIFWIGSTRATVLGSVSKLLFVDKENEAFEKENFQKAQLIYSPLLASGDAKGKNDIRRFKNQVLNSGHMNIMTKVNFKKSKFVKNVKPLIELISKKNILTIGAMEEREGGKARHIFLPTYAIFPYLTDNNIPTEKHMTFSPGDEKIFLNALKLLQ